MPADPGTSKWLCGRAHKPYTDNEEFVPLSDALTALEACQQATIDRAVKLLRERGDYDPHRAGDFLERELRPEGTDA